MLQISLMKFHNVLLACALGAGSLLGAAAPASAAHVSVGTARPAATGRVLPGNRYYGTGYRGYGYRYGYGYPYRLRLVGDPIAPATAIRTATALALAFGFGYVGGGYGYAGGGYGYAPYPAVYGRRAYWARRPYWRPIAAHIREGASFANISLPSPWQGSTDTAPKGTCALGAIKNNEHS